IRTSTDALLNIVNDILDFSKIEAGKMKIEAIDFCLESEIEEVLEFLYPLAAAKGIELLGTFPPGAPHGFRGDPGRLRHVITNLVNNAIKFTEQGEVEVAIGLLGESATRAELEISIRDTGIGIPPDQQRSIFESFTQVDGSLRRKHGGTGLGLAISQKLVQ